MFRVYGGQPVEMGNAGAVAGRIPPGPAPGSSPYTEPSRQFLQERYPFNRPPVPAQQPAPPMRPVQLELPLAGSSNLPAALGNMAGMANSQFYMGPQFGQMPAGFQGKYVS